MQELYTVREVARELKVSRQTVWRWIALGQLPALRLGNRIFRVTGEDLENFKKESTASIARRMAAVSDLQ